MGRRVTVVGAGHQGLAMAAHLGASGVECALWNRSYAGIAEVARAGCVSCAGILEGEFPVPVATTDMEEAMSETLLVATPSSAHRDVARMLAPLVDGRHTVVLNPGRTYGAADFARTLEGAGCRELPTIAETQTIVYTCRRDEGRGVRLYALKDGVPLSTLDGVSARRVVGALPGCLSGHFRATDSMVETSFGNVGMVLHCAPMLMNAGRVESGPPFEYYREGITPSVAGLIERIDAERVRVARALGRGVESTAEWMARTYSSEGGGGLLRAIATNAAYKGITAPATLRHRYLFEDVPNGLVPLESTANALGVDVPATAATITFAEAVLGEDFRGTGRTYDELRGYLPF